MSKYEKRKRSRSHHKEPERMKRKQQRADERQAKIADQVTNQLLPGTGLFSFDVESTRGFQTYWLDEYHND